jgi:hypothetical protein
MTSHCIDTLLRHRDPLLSIAENTHQAAGPKWSCDLTAFFDQLADDPATALTREVVTPIMVTITSLIIAEGVTIATGPSHARTSEIRSSPGYEAAVAAAKDLVQAVELRDPDLGSDIYGLMMDLLSAYLERVRQRDVEDAGSRPAA